jgi:6-phosphogluconolactonase
MPLCKYASPSSPPPPNTPLTCTTSNAGKGEGIYYASLDRSTGGIDVSSSTSDVVNPSYVTVTSDGKYLYSVEETRGGTGICHEHSSIIAVSVFTDHLGIAPGYKLTLPLSLPPSLHFQSVASYRVREDGSLAFINRRPCGGDNPCHVSSIASPFEPGCHLVGVANYSSGNFSLFSTDSEGSLREDSIVWATGPAPDPYNTNDGHAHCILFLPGTSNDPSSPHPYINVVVADLGFDGLFFYKVVYENDGNSGRITLGPCDIYPVGLPDGAGPRQVAFSPTHPTAYIINELNATVCAVEVVSTSDRGVYLSPPPPSPSDDGRRVDENAVSQSFDMLNTGDGVIRKGAGDICVSHCGRWVLASMRGGHNTVTVFEASGEHGRMLTYKEQVSSEGSTPRYICFDPTGTILLVANQDSDTIVTFTFDSDTGKLGLLRVNTVNTPVCMKFV